MTIAHPELEGIGNYEYGWSDKSDAGTNAKRGLNEDVVRDISAKKSEPQWMLDLRLKGLALFEKKPMGEELCQHHCPIAHVASEFPQLCEAETEALSRLLGTHVQRLATIAHGDGVCTTFIPTTRATTKRKVRA